MTETILLSLLQWQLGIRQAVHCIPPVAVCSVLPLLVDGAQTLCSIHLFQIASLSVILFWFDFCFTALQHILGHFGRGRLIQPHYSWASLLGSLPVLSAHNFASNWQLLFLNRRKWENGFRNVSWPSLHERMCRTWGLHAKRTRFWSSYRTRLN